LLLPLLIALASVDSIFTLLPIPACRNELNVFGSQATSEFSAKIHEMGFDEIEAVTSYPTPLRESSLRENRPARR
jgi:hypothetical protein